MNESLRKLVWQRAEGRCEYCQMPHDLEMLPFQIDHVIARKHHGPTSEENLALACELCNSHKGPNIAGIDPTTGETAGLFHPRNEAWKEHFQWDGANLKGSTPMARATIDVLAINMPLRVELRQNLIDEGAFPP